jgi:MFS family permease
MQYRWLALSVTSLGSFMANLDSRIVIVGLPTIGRELGIGLTELIWVTQIYVLVATVFALLVGRMTDIFGRVRLYNIGFGIFTLGSGLSAISFTGYELIASRAIQGIGAAMLIGNSTAILTDAARGKNLATLVGTNFVLGSVGSFAGLSLSGIILSFTNWRALFYINIPIGIFAVVWANRKLVEISEKDLETKIDWLGFILFSVGLSFVLVSLTLLTYGPKDFSFGFSLLAAGILVLVLFFWEQMKVTSPLLQISLLKIRKFGWGNLAFSMQSIGWLALTTLSPFYLQLGLGLSPLQAGIDLLPMQAVVIVSNYLGGKISDRIGRPTLVCSVAIIEDAAGMFLMAATATRASEIQFVGALTLTAVGAGIFISPNTSDVMQSVPATKRGVASGYRATIQGISSSASYGLMVLLLSIIMPYAGLTSLLQVSEVAASSSLRAQFLSATQFAIIVLTILTVVSVVPEIISGTRRSSRTEIGLVE